jgi:hypothetical protein
MLSEAKIISIFCIVDDMLKACGHKEDIRIRVSDSEIITTAIISALYFGGLCSDRGHSKYLLKRKPMRERSGATVCSPWFCLICPDKYRDAAKKSQKKKSVFVTFFAVVCFFRCSRGLRRLLRQT